MLYFLWHFLCIQAMSPAAVPGWCWCFGTGSSFEPAENQLLISHSSHVFPSVCMQSVPSSPVCPRPESRTSKFGFFLSFFLSVPFLSTVYSLFPAALAAFIIIFPRYLSGSKKQDGRIVVFVKARPLLYAAFQTTPNFFILTSCLKRLL